MMVRDFFLYTKLKLQKAKAALIKSIAGILSTNLKDERDFLDRLYQLYILLIVAGWFVIMWFMIISYVQELFLFVESTLTPLILLAFLTEPVVLFIVLAFQFARSSPWKMSHADITYIAAGPVNTRSIILGEVLSQLVLLSILTCALGYLLGIGFASGSELTIDPLHFLLLSALLNCCALVGAWFVGVIRLSLPTRWHRFFFFAVCGVLALCLLLFGSLFLSDTNLVYAAFTPAFFSLFLLLGALGIIVLVWLASFINVTKAIEENALYADTYSIRFMPLTDAQGYSEILRKKRVAARKPRLSLPGGSGENALIAHSFLSHIRQLDGIPHIVVWSFLAAPFTTYLVLNPQSFLLWVILVQLLVLASKGVREITRVFRDDLRNTAVSDHLPFSNMRLLFFDSVLGTALCIVISSVAVSIMIGINSSLLFALLICLIANIVFICCSALEHIPFLDSDRRVSYEISVVIFLAGVFMLSQIGIDTLTLGFMLAYCAALIAVLKFS